MDPFASVVDSSDTWASEEYTLQNDHGEAEAEDKGKRKRTTNVALWLRDFAREYEFYPGPMTPNGALNCHFDLKFVLFAREPV